MENITTPPTPISEPSNHVVMSSSDRPMPSNDVVRSASSFKKDCPMRRNESASFKKEGPMRNKPSNDLVQSASVKKDCPMRSTHISKSRFMVPSNKIASNHVQPQPFLSPYDGPAQLPAAYYGTLFTNYPNYPTLPLLSPFPPHQPYQYCFPPNQHMLDILNQIDYYFSNDNLAKDVYLRSKMDDQGWVPIELIASFKRVSQLTSDHQLILDSMRYSYTVQVQDRKLRRVDNWEKWILPPQVLNR